MGRRAIPRAGTAAIVAWVLVYLTWCGPALAGGSIAELPVERYRLVNGLTVVLAPDPSLEEASVVVHYDVGSADDPPDKEGLAHLVEHLMFDGSRHVAPGEFSRSLARAGATDVNGRTSLDATNYTATLPQGSLPLLFWLESDRMGFVSDRLNQQAFDNERRVIADEMRDKLLDQNFGFVGPTGLLQLYPAWHPYRRSQTEGDLVHCSLDDVRAFLRTWYSPSNATIAVAGGFDAATVRSSIAQYFGDLPDVPPPQRPELPSHWHTRDMHLEAAANVPSDMVTFLWVAPANGQPGDAALDLAAAILTDPDGRLQHDLVAPGLAVFVGSREASSKRMSVFSITVTVADGVPVAKVVTGLDHAIANLGTLVRPEEYQRARKAGLIAQARHTRDRRRMDGFDARQFCASGIGPAPIPDRVARVAAVSAADVRAVARRYLAPEALRAVLDGKVELTAGAQSLGLGEPVFTDTHGRPLPPASTVPAGQKPE